MCSWSTRRSWRARSPRRSSRRPGRNWRRSPPRHGRRGMSASSEALVVEVPVRLAAHLHARPAGQVVQAAARYTARVEICHGEKGANARGVLAVLALGAVAGDTVVVRASGADARAAADAVVEVLT